LQRSETLEPDRARAVVALSGGVDSAVAALLAQRAGLRIIGVTLIFPGVSPDPARLVCETLGIEYLAVEAREHFERCVVSEFVSQSARGRTPNPCVECNPRVKFRLLLEQADALGCSWIVSGHYARVEGAGGHWHLLRGVERGRDQSYMLYRLTQSVLSRLVLPVGELGKPEVRRLAADAGLSAAERKASQDVCFAPDGDVAELIGRQMPEALEPGPIIDDAGCTLGRHRGLARYTVGQRRGLGIGGPSGP